jgi:hypothetical protein
MLTIKPYTFVGSLQKTLEKCTISAVAFDVGLVFSNVESYLKLLKNNNDTYTTDNLTSNVRELLNNFNNMTRYELNKLLMSFEIVPRREITDNNTSC